MNISPQLISVSASFSGLPTSKKLNNPATTPTANQKVSELGVLPEQRRLGLTAGYFSIIFVFPSCSLIIVSGQSARTRCRNLLPSDSWNVLMLQSGGFYFFVAFPTTRCSTRWFISSGGKLESSLWVVQILWSKQNKFWRKKKNTLKILMDLETAATST